MKGSIHTIVAIHGSTYKIQVVTHVITSIKNIIIIFAYCFVYCLALVIRCGRAAICFFRDGAAMRTHRISRKGKNLISTVYNTSEKIFSENKAYIGSHRGNTSLHTFFVLWVSLSKIPVPHLKIITKRRRG
jgi:hypothetical protein